jgi:hypothetical protein
VEATPDKIQHPFLETNLSTNQEPKYKRSSQTWEIPQMMHTCVPLRSGARRGLCAMSTVLHRGLLSGQLEREGKKSKAGRLGWGWSSSVEGLASIHKDLGSIPQHSKTRQSKSTKARPLVQPWHQRPLGWTGRRKVTSVTLHTENLLKVLLELTY